MAGADVGLDLGQDLGLANAAAHATPPPDAVLTADLSPGVSAGGDARATLDASPPIADTDATARTADATRTGAPDTFDETNLADAGPALDGAMPADSAPKCVPTGAEACNGVDDDCDGQTDEGPCDDGNACTLADQCAGFFSCSGLAKACDDGKPCTIDACDPATGVCSAKEVLVGTACNDGDACSEGDACALGICSGSIKVCTALGPCEPQKCQPATGACQPAPQPDLAPCEDGNLCTLGDTCLKGTCKAGKAAECGPDTTCALAGCNAKTGACAPEPKGDGTPCDDGSKCTGKDACDSGECDGKKVDCNDGNPCTADTCDKGSGCKSVNTQLACSDGNACTFGDVCEDAKCLTGGPENCDDGSPCTTDGCDPKSGCTHASVLNNGKPCDADQNACSVGDSCASGACKPGKATACDDGTPCTQDTCDPVSGQCAALPVAANSLCSDGSACTTGDACDGKGTCAAKATVCNDDISCTLDACDPLSGQCGSVQMKAGSGCEDGNPCSGGDTCDAAGVCKAGGKNGCDDGSPCTADTCQGGTKCTATPTAGACDDGSVCTSGDICANGVCGASTDTAVTSLAGAGLAGWKDGPGPQAYFFAPRGVAVGPNGSVWVADSGNHRIRKISTDGIVMTAAGSGVAGSADGAALAATFNSPYGVAVGPGGSVWVADRGNHRIRKIAPDGSVTTLAGSNAGMVDGKGAGAKFNAPSGVAVDKFGWAMVADTGNHRIRRVAPDGSVTSLAGSSTFGWQDGKGIVAQFYYPYAIALDAQGSGWVADTGNHRIRTVAPDGTVATVAGQGALGFQDGAAAAARFYSPMAIAVAPSGVAYVADLNNHRIRRIAAGQVTTLAGQGASGFAEGPGASARFYSPHGVAVAQDGAVWVGDLNNHRIRRVGLPTKQCNDANPCTNDTCDPKLGCSTTPSADGAACSDGSVCTSADACKAGACVGVAKACVDGNACTDDLCDPQSGTCTNLGNTVPCDDGNACTLQDECAGAVCGQGAALASVAAGSHGIAGFKDGAAAAATLNSPGGIDVDPAGNVWFADRNNHRIRRLGGDGVVVTVAGSGTAGFANGGAGSAQFNVPSGVAVLGNGIVVADRSNHRLRLVLADGTVTTLAGSGVGGFTDGPAAAAHFLFPQGVVVDKWGTVWVADTGNHRIRKVLPDGVTFTFAGSGTQGWLDGAGPIARFSSPVDVAIDSQGNLYVADSSNQRIRRVTPAGVVSTVAGTGAAGAINGAGLQATFNGPAGVEVAAGGGVLVADRNNGLLRHIAGSGIVSTVGGGLGPLVGGLGVPFALAVQGDGTLWFSDDSYHVLRKILPLAVVCDDQEPCTLDACNPKFGACVSTKLALGATCDDGDACSTGDACASGGCTGTAKACDDGNACTVDLCDPYLGTCQQVGVPAVCNDGNACSVGESCQAGVCKAEPGLVKTLAGSGTAGWKDGGAAQANFNTLRGVALDGKAELWAADAGNHRIRKVLATGDVATVAGSGLAGFLDGDAANARFQSPGGVAVGADGTVFVADQGNHRIRRIQAGQVTTLAGTGVAGSADGVGSVAQFQSPAAVAVDGGDVLVADQGNHRIRRVTPQGVTTTVAGSGVMGWQDGAAMVARFSSPMGVAVDAGGATWVADAGNHRIRKVAPDGTTTTPIGASGGGYQDGAAASALFNTPTGLAFDVIGRLWITDRGNHRIRRVHGGAVTTVAGGATPGWLDGPALAANFSSPWGIVVAASGRAYVGDAGNQRVRTVEPTAVLCVDGNACTADSCDAKSGQCVGVPVADGTPCSSNACVVGATCKAASCGGTPVMCNDADPCTDDACNAKSGACGYQPTASCTAVRRVFVTSSTFSGNLGGLAGGHLKCQALAEAKALGGQWKAWLADESQAPAQYFSKATAPYRLVTGEVVANSWVDLIDGTLNVPIALDEGGQPVAKGPATCVMNGAKVWTNVQPAGTVTAASYLNSCSNWGTQSTSISYKVGVGSAARADVGWTAACAADKCDPSVPGHLYCFEQTDKFVPKAGGYHVNGAAYVSNVTVVGDFNKSGGYCSKLLGKPAWIAGLGAVLAVAEATGVWMGNSGASSPTENCSLYSSAAATQKGYGKPGDFGPCSQLRHVVCTTDPALCNAGAANCGLWD
ncbi:MAG: hypothetical protein EXR79_13830 [Myxococcales bacterium]|nr:hypothetical protein [Myxococcales bacterium]